MTRYDSAKGFGFNLNPHAEHLARVKRWFGRVRNSENGSVEQYDFLLAFFTSCHHLRDFLKVSGISEEKLSKVVNSQEMKVCRDICNESKHCSLSKPSFYTSLQNGKKHTGLFDGVVVLREFFPVRGSFFTVVVQGDKYDALELAHNCLAVWVRFISENNLK